MQSEELIRQRKRDWQRLESLLHRIEHDQVKSLSQAELVEFGQLYRASTSDLAIALRDFPDSDVTTYLNQLVGRAHPVVYRGEPLVWRRLVEFYRAGLPQLYRELLPFIVTAALLLFVPAAIAYWAMLSRPDSANFLMSPAAIELIRSGELWWKDLNGRNEVGSAFIMTNNLAVSFLAYAGGMLFGLLTVYVLVMNGMHIGAVLGLVHYYGNAGPLWEFIIGHGVVELSVITMAGGSGLLLGYSLLRPGLSARRDALVIAAGKSIRLLLGVAPLLIVAGVIEGLVSPSDVFPQYVKYAVGLATGILLYSYLLLAGRRRSGEL